MSLFRQLALKGYFLVQEILYHQISKQEFNEIIEKNKILEIDPWGVKVLETADHQIVKIFRLKRLISSAYFCPYALRFKWNATRLKKRGIGTVNVYKIVYCQEEQRHVLYYQKVLGDPLKSILENKGNNKIILRKFFEYVAMLHDRGIYFRSLHFGNIIVKPDGGFALIDISNMKFFPFKLTLNQRIRNWDHLMKNEFERKKIESYGWNAFYNEYASLAKLSDSQARKLRLTLRHNEV